MGSGVYLDSCTTPRSRGAKGFSVVADLACFFFWWGVDPQWIKKIRSLLSLATEQEVVSSLKSRVQGGEETRVGHGDSLRLSSHNLTRLMRGCACGKYMHCSRYYQTLRGFPSLSDKELTKITTIADVIFFWCTFLSCNNYVRFIGYLVESVADSCRDHHKGNANEMMER